MTELWTEKQRGFLVSLLNLPLQDNLRLSVAVQEGFAVPFCELVRTYVEMRAGLVVKEC